MTGPISATARRGDSPPAGVASVLDHADARWCSLRPARDAADDLDLLVHPDDLSQALGTLAAAGFVEEPAFGRGSHRFLLGPDPVTGMFRRLDLVTTLDVGPLHALPTSIAAACLDRRVRSEDGWALDPADEFWVTVLHLLADDGADPADPQRTRRLSDLAGRSATTLLDSPAATALAALLPRGVSPDAVVPTLAGSGSPADAGTPARLRRDVRIRCLRSLARDPRSTAVLLRNAALRVTEPFRQWRGRRGLSVAVLGPDGAGKSTLLEALGARWPWSHERIYFGLWPDSHGTGRLGTVLWPLRRPFRAMWRYLLGVVATTRCRLVLFDRYVYDAAVPPRGSRRGLKRLYFAFLLRTVPAPDLVLLLDAPGHVLFARKGEMDPDRLEEHRRSVTAHVHGLRERRGRPRVVTLDARQPAPQVSADASNAIWALAAQRLQGRRGKQPC